MKKNPLIVLALAFVVAISCSSPTSSGPDHIKAPEMPEFPADPPEGDPVTPTDPVVTPTAPAAPDVSATTPTNNVRPTWSWNIPSGAVAFRHSLDGGAWTETAETSFSPATELAAGSHSLAVQARNNTGLWSPSASMAVLIDLSAPDAPVVSADSPTMGRRPTWTWTVPSGTVALRYTYDSRPWTEVAVTSTAFSPSDDLEDGQHRFEIQAKNAIGNWSAAGILVVTVDTVAPIPATLSGAPFSGSSRPTWTWTTSPDSVRVKYRLDGSAWLEAAASANGSFTPAAGLSEGSHEFELAARDTAGNWSASSSRIIVVDTIPCQAPSVGGKTITNELRPTWSWTAPADGVLFRYSLNGGAWVTTTETSFVPATALSVGENTLAVQAADNARNWSASSSWTMVVDLSIPPSPTLSASSPTNAARPTWSVTVPAGSSSLRYRLDGAEWTTVTDVTMSSWSPSGDLAEGDHLLEFQALNAAGTWSASGSKAVTVDLTPPAAPTVNAVTPTDDFTPTWSWSVPSTSSRIEYRVNGGEWVSVPVTTTSYTPSANLSIGTATLEARAVDLAGNRSTVSPAPVSIGYIAPSGLVAVAQSDVSVKLSWTDNSTGESGFVVEQKVSGGGYSTVATLNPNVTSYTISASLSAATSYGYRVRAQYPGGYSDYSSEATATTYPPVNAPTGLAYTVDGKGHLLFTWTDNADNETKYTFRYKNSDAWQWSTFNLPANSTSYTFIYSPGKTYSMSVVASNDNVAAASASVTVSCDAVTAPSGFTATAGDGSVLLAWSASAKTTGYAIERAVWNINLFDDDWTTIGTVSGSTLSYEDATATGAEYYAYRVRAVNEFDNKLSSVVNAGVPAHIASFGDPGASTALSYNDIAWFSFDAEKDHWYVIEATSPNLPIWAVYKTDKVTAYATNLINSIYKVKATETGRIYVKLWQNLGSGTVTVKVRKTPTLSVSLAGTNYPSGSTLVMPTQTTGIATVKSLYLTNVGDEKMTVWSVGIGQYGSGCCSIPEQIPSTINPGVTVVCMVEYNPLTAGNKSDTFYVSSDDPETPSYNLTISGTVTGPVPKVAVLQDDLPFASGSAVDFDSVSFGSEKTLSFTLRNDGQSTLMLNGAPTISGNADYTLSSGPGVSSLAPGASADFTIRFKPEASGARYATVFLKTNDPFTGTFSFTVAGSSSAAKARVALNGKTMTSGQTFDWGEKFATEPKIATLTISNDGTETLTISASIPSGPYLILDRLDPIAPGQTKTVSLRYPTSSVGSDPGSMRLAFNDPSCPTSVINFTGSSLAATCVELEDFWYSGSVEYFGDYDWFYFPVTEGDTYSICCDDVADGTGTYTGNVRLSGYNENFENVYFTDRDNSYAKPISVTASSTGLIAIKAAQSTTNSKGTYRIAIKKTN